MAYMILPPPDDLLGPCADPDCGHRDCAETRRMAAAVCHYCEEPIGYERPLCAEGADAFVHWSCAALAAETAREETQWRS